MPPDYKAKDVANITLINKETGQRIDFGEVVTAEVIKPKPKPVDYLVKLDRKVRNSDIEDLRRVGIHVILTKITHQPNWFVVRVIPQNKDMITRFVEDVIEVLEVRLELSEA